MDGGLCGGGVVGSALSRACGWLLLTGHVLVGWAGPSLPHCCPLPPLAGSTRRRACGAWCVPPRTARECCTPSSCSTTRPTPSWTCRWAAARGGGLVLPGAANHACTPRTGWPVPHRSAVQLTPVSSQSARSSYLVVPRTVRLTPLAAADGVLCGRQARVCQVHGLLPLPLLHCAARHRWAAGVRWWQGQGRGRADCVSLSAQGPPLLLARHYEPLLRHPPPSAPPAPDRSRAATYAGGLAAPVV